MGSRDRTCAENVRVILDEEQDYLYEKFGFERIVEQYVSVTFGSSSVALYPYILGLFSILSTLVSNLKLVPALDMVYICG